MILDDLIDSRVRNKPTRELTEAIVQLVGKELKNPRFAGYRTSVRNNMIHYAVIYIQKFVMIRAEHFQNNDQIIKYCKQLCDISFVETLNKLKRHTNENKTSNRIEERPQDEKREDGRTRSTRFHEGNFGRWVIRGL